MSTNDRGFGPFAFSDVTNVETHPQICQKKILNEKFRRLLAYRHVLHVKKMINAAKSEEIPHAFLVKEAIVDSKLQALQKYLCQPTPEDAPLQPRGVLKKVNCHFFRGKKAIFKASNVRISFEIRDPINN